jgi:hypothetical protein
MVGGVGGRKDPGEVALCVYVSSCVDCSKENLLGMFCQEGRTAGAV